MIKTKKILRLISSKIWIKGLFHNIAANVELENLIKNLNFETVFDIGSNKGQFTILIEGLYPNKVIYSFDPLIENIEKQKKFFKNSNNIFFYNYAISNNPEINKFYVTKRKDSSSFLKVKRFSNSDYKIVEERKVIVKSIEEIYKITNFPKNILVKIDVQGYELNVLKSAKACLRHIKYIIIEVSDTKLYEDQALYQDVYNFLLENNFELKKENIPDKIKNTNILQKDVLFTNRLIK